MNGKGGWQVFKENCVCVCVCVQGGCLQREDAILSAAHLGLNEKVVPLVFHRHGIDH